MLEQPNREKEIFSEALERDLPEARLAYVQGACGSDHALRERVETLLKAYASAGGFLPNRDGPGQKMPAVPAPVPLTEEPGTVIDRYKLLQHIGAGGFGAVYMAEQQAPVKRRVALKIIKLGMDTRQVVARFEAERQALALMDHPNIAKVLDAGATESGRPYFVMELVRGVAITQYCDENNLPPVERLTLFIQVCRAIQHAHQKGLIHRDIKPSNILVTLHDGVPVPKVIDFGIAKATQQELTAKTVFTQFQQFIGTPAYMSPEQAEMSGLDIDTRSDIYSLGVLLYELLTSQTPFDVKALLASGLDEMRRTIREEEPVRPSTRISTMVDSERTSVAKHRQSDAGKLVHLFRGDLDWIVMKCLEKDRTRRYETANGIAADLQRHLNNEPVVARPPSVTYRFQKLVRRNKLAVAAASAVTLTLIAGLSFSTCAFLRERKAHASEAAQHRTAVEQRTKAEAAQASEAVQRKLADMQLALQMWEEGDVQGANDLIEASRPAPGQAPAFEWRYLRKLCQDESIETFGDPNHSCRSALFFDRDVLLLNDEKKLTLRDLSRRKDQVLLEDQDGIWNPALCSGNSNLLATATDDGRIKVWDLAARHVRVEFEGNPRSPTATTESPFYSIIFSRDGRWLASASWDNSVKLWEVESRNPKPVWTVRHYSYSAYAVVFSPDGRHLFSSGSEAMIRAWDVATGAAETALLEGHTGWIRALATSPDGLWMASGSGDSTVIVWDAISRKLEKRFFGHTVGINALVFSPDQRILASGGYDGTIRLWDLNTAQQISLLRGHGAKVKRLSFSPDGQLLASQSDDGLVKLWHTTPGAERNALTGSPGWLQDVALSPDGRHLASVVLDTFAVNLWDLPPPPKPDSPLRPHQRCDVRGLFPRRQDARHRQSRPDGEAVGRERSQGRRHAHQRISRGIARLFTGRTNAGRRRLHVSFPGG